MPKIENKSEEQKVAEAGVESFRKDLGPFVVAAETTRMPMVFTDAKEPGHPIIFANDSFQVEAAFAGGTDHGSEIRYRRKDGSMFWAAIFISRVRDDGGEVVQHFASFVDLTKQKQEQAQSTMMINELNHRVKNTLATVQSIVWQALRSGSDPKVIRESIESRLFALSRSHDLLTRENWEAAGLLDLVNEAMEPFGVANGRTERLVITGKNIRLPPNVTLALGIAFHELATNAVKYGAFSNEAGSILLAWTIEPRPEGDRLILCWQEKDGPPVTPPTRKGFGSRVIERGLPHELQGTVNLDYRGDGMVCTINIPAPRGARDE